MKTFASQYGPPDRYTLIQRAKLLGTFGVLAHLIDSCQQATLAPYSKQNEPPKSLLPDTQQQKTTTPDMEVAAVSKAELDEILGIGRRGR